MWAPYPSALVVMFRVSGLGPGEGRQTNPQFKVSMKVRAIVLQMHSHMC